MSLAAKAKATHKATQTNTNTNTNTTMHQYQKYTYSYQIDGYLIQTATVEASTGKEARDKIRASHKGRKVSSFIPA
jgi:hypothetical protein